MRRSRRHARLSLFARWKRGRPRGARCRWRSARTNSGGEAIVAARPGDGPRRLQSGTRNSAISAAARGSGAVSAASVTSPAPSTTRSRLIRSRSTASAQTRSAKRLRPSEQTLPGRGTASASHGFGCGRPARAPRRSSDSARIAWATDWTSGSTLSSKSSSWRLPSPWILRPAVAIHPSAPLGTSPRLIDRSAY